MYPASAFFEMAGGETGEYFCSPRFNRYFSDYHCMNTGLYLLRTYLVNAVLRY
jgi:hypothetical protein